MFVARLAAEGTRAMEVSDTAATAAPTRRNAPKYRPAPTFRYLFKRCIWFGFVARLSGSGRCDETTTLLHAVLIGWFDHLLVSDCWAAHGSTIRMLKISRRTRFCCDVTASQTPTSHLTDCMSEYRKPKFSQTFNKIIINQNMLYFQTTFNDIFMGHFHGSFPLFACLGLLNKINSLQTCPSASLSTG